MKVIFSESNPLPHLSKRERLNFYLQHILSNKKALLRLWERQHISEYLAGLNESIDELQTLQKLAKDHHDLVDAINVEINFFIYLRELTLDKIVKVSYN